ncbi:hypothetical protein GPECTOR_4g883 [Gonium pectorale]|uniref:alpha-1,2-Mannosidase n=1 Tax=Gonium pectorale TaxID=33097 RepID=A0A150GYM1_GONPE|nr:hypothetical protein GPECTOR_4g883 [Gonium pectorale]|eukprot:KXZ54812.1 hypothetical protein GPECTOR_4g883 [Gonium pectorale]
MRHHPHKDAKYRIWQLPKQDVSPRCVHSHICDGKHVCDVDSLGCITDALTRKSKVREAARWTWQGYRKYAWGHDELNAGSRSNREWFRMGLTIVDSLDTLQILGLLEEYAEARYWVINHLDMNQGDVSVFETTIRILGGLAAAFYHSGGDEVYLLKAVEFADRLLPAFNTSSGLAQPHFSVHDKNAAAYRASVGGTCLAEVATLSMEFSAVTRISGRPEYRETAMVTWYQLAQMNNMDGLYCTNLNGDSLTCNGNHFTFGAAADSAYEYMLKQWILTNGSDTICLDMYKRALQGMRKHMLTKLWMGDDIGDVWIVADNDNGVSRQNVLEHLTCFLPGTMALGHMYGINTASGPDEDDDLMVAVKLMKACYELYHQSPSGVAFDSVSLVPHFSPPPPPPPSPPPSPPPAQANGTGGSSFAGQGSNGSGSAGSAGVNSAGGNGGAAGQGQAAQGQGGGGAGSSRRLLQHEARAKAEDLLRASQGGQSRRQQEQSTEPPRRVTYRMTPRSRESFLRPEVTESLFYLWRATGDPIYREWGWNMFRAYDRWCRVGTGGFQVLQDVTSVPPVPGNKMESFWMAETMKYFYLLFSDDPEEIPLDEFVFNTEAHPLAIWGSKTDVKLRKALARFHGTKLQAAGEALEDLPRIARFLRKPAGDGADPAGVGRVRGG